MRTLILALVILSCSREQPGIEFNCSTPGLPQPVKAVSARLDSFEFAQEKVNPDFTLSVFTDRTMTFSQAVVQVKRMAEEYKRAGLVFTVPEATIFRIDTFPKWRSSADALSFFLRFPARGQYQGDIQHLSDCWQHGRHCLCAWTPEKYRSQSRRGGNLLHQLSAQVRYIYRSSRNRSFMWVPAYA